MTVLIVGNPSTDKFKRTLNNVALALNSEGIECLANIALNFSVDDLKALPDWIMLLPPGPEIKGRDGREWKMSDPEKLLAEFLSNGVDLPIDIEHATHLKGPKGEAAPAVGWIKELEIRAGAIWGRVEWNNHGGYLLTDKEYRYISPVFLYEKKTNEILRLKSVALTNQPNLALPALNREGQFKNKEDKMDLPKLLAALGLPATTTFDGALNHIKELNTNLATALNQAKTPSMELFIPRADYDTAVKRAENAEGEVQKQKDAELETAINTEVDAAVKAGKITPATKDYYIAQCKQEGGLDSFKKFAAAAPVIAKDVDLGEIEDGGKALNAETQAVADLMGNSAEDIAKYGK